MGDFERDQERIRPMRERLAEFDREVDRGIMHTVGWVHRMRQERQIVKTFDEASRGPVSREVLEALGLREVGGPE